MGEVSSIEGLLKANGTVYLINPNGVLIGPQGKIQVGNFIASTLQLQDEEYLAASDLRFTGNSESNIVNQGVIEACEGDVFLIARDLSNTGSIKAERGSVTLLAGSEILLQERGERKIFVRPAPSAHIENSGSILAAAAELHSAGGNLYSCAINHSGLIQATGIQEKEGKILLFAEDHCLEASGRLIASRSDDVGGAIHLLGEKVFLVESCSIDASGAYGGGEVLVGGDFQGSNPEIQNAAYTWGGKGVEVKVDAWKSGDGGKAIFWSDEATFFYGNISARGGKIGGDGGLVEVSGKLLEYQGLTDTEAPGGKVGTLLLDPNDIVIGAVATTGSFPGCPTNTYTITAATLTNQILNMTGVNNLDTQLAGACNVTITTVGSGGAGPNSGSITVSSPVSWSTTNTLTLTAASFISISAAISNTSATTGFTAMNFTANGTTAAGVVGITVTTTGSVTTTGGTISLTGTGGGAAGGGCHGVLVAGAGKVTTTSGVITIMGTAKGTTTLNNGVLINGGGTVSATGIGTITITGNGGTTGTTNNNGIEVTGVGSNITSNSGLITLNGTGPTAGTSNCNGISVDTSAMVTSTSGGIMITAVGGKGTGTCNGLLIKGPTSAMTAGGAINITATSGGGTGNGNVGIYVTAGGALSATGTGTITLNGTGGGTGTTNYGVQVDATPGITSSTGMISITGNGGVGTNTDSGVNLTSAGDLISSSGGSITVIGTAQGTGTANNGISMAAGSIIATTGTGQISLTGTASGTSGFGVTVNASTVSTVSGTLMITGTGSGASTGIDMVGAATIGGASTTGNITLTSPTITLTGTLQSTGQLFLLPTSAASSIGIGGVGTYSVSSAAIASFMSFSTITFGNPTQNGLVTINTTQAFSSNLIVYGNPITNTTRSLPFTGAQNATFNVGLVSSGSLTFSKVVATTGTYTINGGNFGNAFTLSNTTAGGPATATLNGGTGSNTLTGPASGTNTWTVTGSNTGTLLNSTAGTTTTFNSIQNLAAGSPGIDTFDFTTAGATITGTVTGNDPAATTNSTLLGPNSATTWNLTANNGGNISGVVTFTQIGNLTGGSSSNDFIFTNGVVYSGTITGGTSTSNTMDFSAYTTSTNVSMNTLIAAGTAFANIQTFDGGSTGAGPFSNTFTATNATTDAWVITGTNSGTFSNGTPPTINFNNFQNLTGGTGIDTFTFTTGTISGAITGALGVNTIVGPSSTTYWTVNGTNTGSIGTSAGSPTSILGSFATIRSLTGGTGNNTFAFTGSGNMSGTVTGGGGTNTMDYSGYTTAAVSLNLSTAVIAGTAFANIQSFIGSNSFTTNSVAGTNGTTNTWTITGNNAGAFCNGPILSPCNGTVSANFSNFQDLIGGNGVDTFDFSLGFMVTSVAGGGGADNLKGPISTILTTWNISTSGAGTITGGGFAGSLAFSSISNLIGGSGTGGNDFIFSAARTVLSVNGGSSSGNTMDLHLYTTATSVNLATNTATGATLAGGVTNIQTFIGGTGAIQNTFTGANTGNTWMITGNNAGTVNNGVTLYTFSNYNNLVDGTGTGSFTFTGAFQLNGTTGINGTTASNHTIVGPNVVNTWTITGNNAGNLNPTGASGATTFANIGNLTGGTAPNTFTFNGAFNLAGAAGITGGGSALDVINGPNATTAWTITGNNAGTIGTTNFSVIPSLVGGSANDTFTFNGAFQLNGTTGISGGSGGNDTVVGPNVINTWAITGNNAGTLNPAGASGATTFANIGNLTGGTAANTFTFNGAFQLNGTTGISGGLMVNDTIVGPNVVNTWTITGNNAGNLNPTGAIGATLFSNIGNLTGGALVNTFTFNGAFQLAGTTGITGGGSAFDLINGRY